MSDRPDTFHVEEPCPRCGVLVRAALGEVHQTWGFICSACDGMLAVVPDQRARRHVYARQLAVSVTLLGMVLPALIVAMFFYLSMRSGDPLCMVISALMGAISMYAGVQLSRGAWHMLRDARRLTRGGQLIAASRNARGRAVPETLHLGARRRRHRGDVLEGALEITHDTPDQTGGLSVASPRGGEVTLHPTTQSDEV